MPVLRPQVARPAVPPAPGGAGVPAVAATIAWTGVAAAGLGGLVELPVIAWAVLSAFPIVLLALAVFREAPSRGLRLSAAWIALTIAAVSAAALIAFEPLIALAVPGLVAVAWVTTRFPAASVVSVFALTGTFGTIQAFTPLPANQAIEVLLAGLWLGAIWGYLMVPADRPVWIWPGLVGMLLYLAVTGMQFLLADSATVALQDFRIGGWYVLAAFLVAYAPWPDTARGKIARGVLVVAIVVGAYGVFRLIVGPADAELQQARAERDVLSQDRLNFIGSFFTNKQIAAWTATVIPFTLIYALAFRSRWRVVGAVATLLLGICLIGADSRLQIASCVVGVLVVLVLYHMARGFPGLNIQVTAAAIAAAIVAGVVAVAATGGVTTPKGGDFTAFLQPKTENSFQARIAKWESILPDVMEAPLGHGLGSGGTVQRRFGRFATEGSLNLDNSYLDIGYQQGPFVMVLYAIGLLVLLGGLARRAILTTNPEHAAAAIGASGSVISLAALGFFSSSLTGTTGLAAWLILGVGLAPFTKQERAAGIDPGAQPSEPEPARAP